MQLAVNYSYPLAQLLREGRVQINYFKCPAWPDLLATAQAQHPVYVHFPFTVGAGKGITIDTEAKQPADWDKFERMLAQTQTPFVNLHLVPTPQQHPDIPAESTEAAHVAQLSEHLIADVQAVIARFGKERVLVENDHGGEGRLRAAYLPNVLCHIVAETGCGFLFDLSHARLAALELGVDAHEYINALPLAHMREMHLTGIQMFDEQWVKRLRAAGVEETIIQRFVGRPLDHLPMVEEDWHMFAWAFAQFRSGAWRVPWIVSLECGGVGALWEALTSEDTLAAQVPRLYSMVHQV